MAISMNQAFRYCLRGGDADEFEGPGLERRGLGGADVEGTALAEADVHLGERGEALQEAAEEKGNFSTYDE